MTQAQENFLKSTNLSGLLAACIGERITVELRNEAYVTGKLVQSDGFMSVTLENVELIDPSGNKIKFDSFFVNNRLIRYVQLPESMDIGEVLSQHSESFRPGGRGRGRGRGRGAKLSKSRKQIMEARESRRQEDIKNALKMKEEMMNKKKADQENKTKR